MECWIYEPRLIPGFIILNTHMREYEIINEASDLSIRDRLKVLFKERGFKEIGEGSFARVYSNGKNVLKVYERDECYKQFLNFVASHAGNPHFPKTIGPPKVLNPAKDIWMVKLEKLQPVPQALWGYLQSLRDALLAMYKNPAVEDSEDFKKLVSQNPSLANTCINIYNDLISKNAICRVDMHPRNFMQRGDGTIVIADPICDPDAWK